MVKTINSITRLENEVATRENIDLPKGSSYKLDFIGSNQKAFVLINGYCLYNDVVYKVNRYQMIIQDLREKFGIVEEDIH